MATKLGKVRKEIIILVVVVLVIAVLAISWMAMKPVVSPSTGTPAGVCGDKVCNSNETKDSCPADCTLEDIPMPKGTGAGDQAPAMPF
jgi:hypothetical protein